MKHTKIDKARLKAAIEAIKGREGPDGPQLRLAQQARIAQFRRKLGKELRPLFAGARFDVGALDKALGRHQVELREALKKDTAKIGKAFAKAARDRERGMANTARAWRHIETKPLLTTLIPLTTPYLIYATPLGMLQDSHIEPWNNFAKFAYTNDQDTGFGAVVKFFFAWQNPSDYLAVINCETNLLINGIIEATAEQGWLASCSAFVELTAELTVYVGSLPPSTTRGPSFSGWPRSTPKAALHCSAVRATWNRKTSSGPIISRAATFPWKAINWSSSKSPAALMGGLTAAPLSWPSTPTSRAAGWPCILRLTGPCSGRHSP